MPTHALMARCSRRDVRLGMFLVELDELDMSDARQAARATRLQEAEDGGQFGQRLAAIREQHNYFEPCHSIIICRSVLSP